MATCNKCGEEIEFRYIDGRCKPIHQGGGWHCSGSDSDTTSSQVRSSGVRDWTLRNESLCRSTTCPECGQDVFFIQHNGGSVWVDESLHEKGGSRRHLRVSNPKGDGRHLCRMLFISSDLRIRFAFLRPFRILLQP